MDFRSGNEKRCQLSTENYFRKKERKQYKSIQSSLEISGEI